VATLNNENVRILAEPMGTRRMDDITILDLRVEKASDWPETVASQRLSTSSIC
jgi:hypothetical protein